MYSVGLLLISSSWAVVTMAYFAMIVATITRRESQPERARRTTRKQLRDSVKTARRTLAGRTVGRELRRHIVLLEVKRRQHIAIIMGCLVVGGVNAAGWLLTVAPPRDSLPEWTRAIAGMIITGSALYVTHDLLDRDAPILPMLASANVMMTRKNEPLSNAPTARGRRIKTDLLNLRRAGIAAARTIEYQTQGVVGLAKHDAERHMAGTALAILELQRQVLTRAATPRSAEEVRDLLIAIVNYDFALLPVADDRTILAKLYVRGPQWTKLVGWLAIPVTGVFLLLQQVDVSPYLALGAALLAVVGPALDLYVKHRSSGALMPARPTDQRARKARCDERT